MKKAEAISEARVAARRDKRTYVVAYHKSDRYVVIAAADYAAYKENVGAESRFRWVATCYADGKHCKE